MKAFGLVDLFILIQNISYLFCYLYVLELRTTFFLMSLLGSQSCRASMQSCARLAPNRDTLRLNGTRYIANCILRVHVLRISPSFSHPLNYNQTHARHFPSLRQRRIESVHIRLTHGEVSDSE
ncbi:hypothetical protein BDW60DRAFT_82531 [Aspergillus nidulans var. acristatus]